MCGPSAESAGGMGVRCCQMGVILELDGSYMGSDRARQLQVRREVASEKRTFCLFIGVLGQSVR